jgi:hypothetical protein
MSGVDMKKLIMALVFAGFAGFHAPTTADADVNVRVYLGVPYYSYRVGPDYEYRRGYGWYLPSSGKISCTRAMSILRNHGYYNVGAVECRGKTYTFRATRNGKRYIMHVSSRNGGFWRA